MELQFGDKVKYIYKGNAYCYGRIMIVSGIKGNQVFCRWLKTKKKEDGYKYGLFSIENLEKIK